MDISDTSYLSKKVIMGNSLEEFKLLEKIKISYLKNRGREVAVSEELNLPLDYIKKVVAKLRKKESKDVSFLISNNLMQYIMMGYEARTHSLVEMLKALEGRDKIKLSICCEAPVTEENGKFTCLACSSVCNTKILDKEGIIELKLNIIEQLRKEDESLVDFAERMGYSNKPEVPPAPQVKQEILVLGGNGNQQIMIDQLRNLPPIERDRIVEKLSKEIIDIEQKEESKENAV